MTLSDEFTDAEIDTFIEDFNNGADKLSPELSSTDIIASYDMGWKGVALVVSTIGLQVGVKAIKCKDLSWLCDIIKLCNLLTKLFLFYLHW